MVISCFPTEEFTPQRGKYVEQLVLVHSFRFLTHFSMPLYFLNNNFQSPIHILLLAHTEPGLVF